MIKNSKKSFTIIEVLVVVSILALLSTTVIVSVNHSRAKGRDAKRKAEMNVLHNVLTYYYIENDKYPEKQDNPMLYSSLEDDPGLVGGKNFSETMSNWIATIPNDPLFGQEKAPGRPFSYRYKTTNEEATGFKLIAELETGGNIFYEFDGSGGDGTFFTSSLCYSGGVQTTGCGTELYGCTGADKRCFEGDCLTCQTVTDDFTDESMINPGSKSNIIVNTLLGQIYLETGP